MGYAQNTSVSTERSEAEIKRNLVRHGADQIGVMADAVKGAMVMFRMGGRTYRFALRMPDPADEQFTTRGHNSGNRIKRPAGEAQKMWEQACRSHWRALNLVIKAKLEAVDAGIVTFEDEFMPHAMINPHQTIGDVMKPQLEAYYESGKPPAGLPMLTGPEVS